MSYEVGNAPLHHRLQMDGREKLMVSGVEDVARFDESCIVLTTCEGTVIITGTDLHIGKLTLEGGELHVDGRVDAVAYEDGPRDRGSLLRRLFG